MASDCATFRDKRERALFIAQPTSIITAFLKLFTGGLDIKLFLLNGGVTASSIYRARRRGRLGLAIYPSRGLIAQPLLSTQEKGNGAKLAAPSHARVGGGCLSHCSDPLRAEEPANPVHRALRSRS